MGANAKPILKVVSILVIAGVASSLAQDIDVQPLDLGGPGELLVVDGAITGDEVVDYEVTGQASAILFVDLLTSGSAYFNVTPAGAEQAIFIGTTDGNVASVPLPESGRYIVRVYLVRASALTRRSICVRARRRVIRRSAGSEAATCCRTAAAGSRAASAGAKSARPARDSWAG